jgi:hypothetical protein
MFSTFDGNNAPLTSGTIQTGPNVFTSGLFASLSQNAIVPFNPAPELTTSAFYALISPVVGSFDLISAQANFEHVIFTSGPSHWGRFQLSRLSPARS